MKGKIHKNDQVALITGCGSGIARHLCTVMSEQGYRILAADINPDSLKESAKTLAWDSNRVQLAKLDVRSHTDWRKAISVVIKKWSRLDVCMNIAGFDIQGFVRDFQLEHIDLHLDINAKGAILGTKFAADVMIRQGHGHIINMCSLAGLAPVPGISLYSASKFALRGFTLAAYYELKPLGVHVSLVEPDLVDTAKLTTQLIYDEDQAAAVGFSAPRILTVEDISRKIIIDVLGKKKLEVAIPGYRGLLCKFGGSFPTLSEKLFGAMAKSGLKSIAKERARRGNLKKLMTPDRWILEKELKRPIAKKH